MNLLSYSYRVPLAVPYWRGTTYRGMLRSFLTGSVVAGPDRGKLRAAVIKRLGTEDAIVCGSGSLALEIALRACGVQEGDEVVVPTFCCTSVVPPILAVGALPVLTDIGEELNITAETVRPVLTSKTTAIIVPHLFGNPADIRNIIDLARCRNIRVIDDAAQALGATVDGRSVGSFGAAGILSFGSEKICFGLGGGVVAFPRKEYLNSVSTIDLPPAQLSATLRALFSTLAWRRWRRWTLPVQAWMTRAHTGNPDSPPAPYRKETLANLSAAVALSLVEALENNIAARRARIRVYRELLGDNPRLQLISHQPGSACLTQVVRVLPGAHDEDRSLRLIEALRRAGYEVQGSYVPIHLLPYYERYGRGRLPNAERLWSDLIELPCEPEISFADVERIARVIKRALERTGFAASAIQICPMAPSRPASGGELRAVTGARQIASGHVSTLGTCGDRAFRCISHLSQKSLNGE